MRVLITGGSGRIGRAAGKALVEQGATVRTVDIVPNGMPGHRVDDLRELRAALQVVEGVDAILHLAGIGTPPPDAEPRAYAEAATLLNNVVSTYNVFKAAATHGVEKVVWASTEMVMGMPFLHHDPDYLPIDERHPRRPRAEYALSKVIAEELATHLHGWRGTSFVGLRFSVVMDEGDYVKLPGYWSDPAAGRWNMWSYVDIRDAVAACILALESDVAGAQTFLVSAADTLMDRPTADLLAEWFPRVPLRRAIGEFESMLSWERAHRHLGYEPRHSWRRWQEDVTEGRSV